MNEVEQLKDQLTSIKSSLAEKEAELDRLRERHDALHDQRFAEARKVDDLSAQLASLKQENERWQAADSKAVAALQSQLDENEKELAQLQLENERLKQDRSDALNVKSKEGLTASEWLLRTGKAEALVAQLQLENGVKDEAIRVGLSHLEERAGCKDCPELKQMEQALSTSTKSSLMEKVRGLMRATEKLLNPQIEWVNVGCPTSKISYEPIYAHRISTHEQDVVEAESALTEVKKAGL